LGDEGHKSDIESARSDIHELKNVSDNTEVQKKEEKIINQIEILDGQDEKPK
jgi:hypothetical protein